MRQFIKGGSQAQPAGGGVRLRFEPIDELLEDSLERGIAGVGVAADDVDGFAVAVGEINTADVGRQAPPRLQP